MYGCRYDSTDTVTTSNKNRGIRQTEHVVLRRDRTGAERVIGEVQRGYGVEAERCAIFVEFLCNFCAGNTISVVIVLIYNDSDIGQSVAMWYDGHTMVMKP